jgi:hypothetical protein
LLTEEDEEHGKMAPWKQKGRGWIRHHHQGISGNRRMSSSSSLGTGMITETPQVRVETPATVKEGGFKGLFHPVSPTLPGGRCNGAKYFHHLFIITIFIGDQRKPKGGSRGPTRVESTRSSCSKEIKARKRRTESLEM